MWKQPTEQRLAALGVSSSSLLLFISFSAWDPARSNFQIFSGKCVCIQGVSEVICLGRRSLMVQYYVLLPKHQKEIGQIGYLLGMSQGAFTANSPCKSPKPKPLFGHCLTTFPRLISPLKIEPKSAIWLLGIHPEKTIIQKDACNPGLIQALFTVARMWKQHKCPLTDEWIKMIWYKYTTEYYSVIKKGTQLGHL